MSTPEFPIHVSLPEKPDAMRKAAGHGKELFPWIVAEATLEKNEVLAWALQGQINISQDPEFYSWITPLGTETPEDLVDISSLPPTTRAAKYVSRFAHTLRYAGTQGTLIDIQTSNQKRPDGLVIFHDLSVGMDVVPSIIGSIEGIREYDKVEGIDDATVKTLLEQYKNDPLQVLRDAVTSHTDRYHRYENQEEYGIYVPEFVVAGARHGQALFENIYNALSGTSPIEIIE